MTQEEYAGDDSAAAGPAKAYPLLTAQRVQEADTEAGDCLRRLVGEFTDIVCDPQFPCFFAGRAMAQDDVLFALVPVEETRSAGMLQVMRDAATAVRTDPRKVVVIFVEQNAQTMEADRYLAAQILRQLAHHDTHGWPPDEPVHPEDPRWTFWFDGVDFFFNFSTPSHVLRRSRNLGPCFTIVTQSRSSFDLLGASSARSRALIRQRIAHYDAIPPHPALGEFGSPGNRELMQYFLGDTNEPGEDLVGAEDLHAAGARNAAEER
jgi:FPC/CPF motif-containing protein YcgG